MTHARAVMLSVLAGCALAAAAAKVDDAGAASPAQARPARNFVVFVADGLRAGSVTEGLTPTLFALSRSGTWFANSHSVVPSLTMPNAAAIATGHDPGDSGVFGNTLYPGFRQFASGNYGRMPGTPVPFIEVDAVLGDLDDHFEGNWLGEGTLLALARLHGYGTAAIGKHGPVALQDVSQLRPEGGRFTMPATLVLDDLSGTADGVPMDPELVSALARAGLPVVAAARRQPAGNARDPGTHEANTQQQSWLIAATTRAVLPLLRQRGRPFMLVYWSRDPDGSQHNQGDSLNKLVPGINGPTSLAGIRDADDNLRQLLAAIDADPALAGNTDVLVTSDHGFSTISRREVDREQHTTTSAAALRQYNDVPAGFLPPGFVALDLARQLGLPLYDPDTPLGATAFHRLRLDGDGELRAEHPAQGNGLLGGAGISGPGGTDARAIVAANGGVDLVYLPFHDRGLLTSMVEFLGRQDYVGALFVDDAYGPLPGTLPLSAIGFIGTARVPVPALVVGLRSFEVAGAVGTGPLAPLLNSALVADTGLQQGQGMHGSLSRANTFNFMAARGPDFRAGFSDRLPVGNADLVPTIAAVLGWQWPAQGQLKGRVLGEALAGPAHAWTRGRVATQRCTRRSVPMPNGLRTVLEYQRAAGRIYVDEARFEADVRRPAPAGEDCR
jgi:arylsulfatase A-like enzyme